VVYGCNSWSEEGQTIWFYSGTNSTFTFASRENIYYRYLCYSVLTIFTSWSPSAQPASQDQHNARMVQEGWLSPTEHASVYAISLRHIFGLTWVLPWNNRGKCYMDEKRIQCLSTHRSMYPSIFNRFPVILPVSSKVCHLSTFFAHFGLPWVCPWDNRGKCYMDGKRIQCWSKRITACTHLSSTVNEL